MILALTRFSCLAALSLGAPADSSLPLRRFQFGYDGVLGTSLDITFIARTEATAARAETALLSEIERLRKVLSSYDSHSELGTLLSNATLPHPSTDLTEVLHLYEIWRTRSNGAYTARITPLTALWRGAAASGMTPDSAMLRGTVARIASPAWRVDDSSGAIFLLATDGIDLSSLGKGYIIDHALAAVRRAAPEVAGGLINLGGDIRSWGVTPDGDSTWQIGVTDPRSPADNAAPLTVLNIGDRAVSSSGGYARGVSIGGIHYSHIIDPRTGIPADRVVATTVVSRDNATANAMATTLSILSPPEGLALAEGLPGVEALIIEADGTEHRTTGFARFEKHATRPSLPATLKASVTIDITPQSPNRHRPYVAVWVTDTNGKLLKTLAFWGTKAKYVRELSKWYDLAKPTQPMLDAVTRATRSVGSYTLEWDGLAEDNSPVDAGTFVFWFEESFENGPHSLRSTKVACTAAGGTGTFDATSAFAGGSVTCTSGK